MRTTLGVLAGFTTLACGWLTVMYLLLQHPGFEWKAAVSALLVAQSALTAAAMARVVDGPAVRAMLLVGGAAVAALGAWAFAANESSAHWEGYMALISLALVLQGVLTLAVVLTGPKPASWASPSAPAAS